MTRKKIFIDGSAGTTGLRIRERLLEREDVELITLSEALRKDTAARRDALNNAEVAFLCLPDAAAIEAVSLVENPQTVIIDTSTAHRTNPAWTYGFPEIDGLKTRLPSAKRIANPGCHASGFIALVAPLIEAGLIKADQSLSAFSLTGYSGGGKKMIADYEVESAGGSEGGEKCALNLHSGGRQYALSQAHKHLPEMMKLCKLTRKPIFSPIVVPHYSGMEVTVPLFLDKGNLEIVRDCYRKYYAGAKIVRFVEALDDAGFISSAALSGRDDMLVGAYGDGDRVLLVALYDNLGKGASGAAIQNLNLVLGVEESSGLKIGV